MRAHSAIAVVTVILLGFGLKLTFFSGPIAAADAGSTRNVGINVSAANPLGATVNLASRVQDATKKLGVSLLLTSATRERLPINFTTNRVGRAQLPGVADGVVLHELLGESGSVG